MSESTERLVVVKVRTDPSGEFCGLECLYHCPFPHPLKDDPIGNHENTPRTPACLAAEVEVGDVLMVEKLENIQSDIAWIINAFKLKGIFEIAATAAGRVTDGNE